MSQKFIGYYRYRARVTDYDIEVARLPLRPTLHMRFLRFPGEGWHALFTVSRPSPARGIVSGAAPTFAGMATRPFRHGEQKMLREWAVPIWPDTEEG